MSRANRKRLDELEPLIMAQAGKLENSVYGIVDRVDDGVPNIIRRWKGSIGRMVETDEEPTILVGEKFEPLILKHKKYKAVFGGRAGMKSRFASDAMVGEVNSCGSKVYAIRERMKSLKQSIYASILATIDRLQFNGFMPVESKWEIRHKTGGEFAFGGMQNIIDMKGSVNFKFFLMEEAARTKQETIDTLGPTLRDVEGAELWYIWNPESSNDAMSKEFILPYQAELDRCGYYEDDYHIIIKTTYRDNPWFMGDESLKMELSKDESKVERGLMSKARFDHIWNGAFNDGIEDGIIHEDWFDACVDAHLKLGFKAIGAVTATHDPADTGTDEKTIAIRQGVVFTYMEEIAAENGNRALDYACGIAINHNVDHFGWDCDGMGALLRDQVEANFKGKKVDTWMFKGSHSVHMPEAVYAFSDNYGIKGQKKNKEVFRNKRAQRYVELADRMFKTWEAVTAKERGEAVYHNPDELISFSSDINCLTKLRAELCRLPRKKNNSGMIELYTKADMVAGITMSDGRKLSIPSPNLADDVMMSFDRPDLVRPVQSNAMPPSLNLPRYR